MSFLDYFKKGKLTDEKAEEESLSNQIATGREEDGAIELDSGAGINAFLYSTDFVYNNQAELLESYRKIANYAVVDYAIDDIVNEMVSFSEHEKPIELDLSELNDELSENIRNKIHEKMEKIDRILNLKNTIHRRLRSFYVDGRMVSQKVVNPKKMTDGLLNVIELEPAFVTKLRKVNHNPQTKTIDSIEESFIYNEAVTTKGSKNTQTNKSSNAQKEAFELHPDSITYVTSGLVDQSTGYAISWLHKAVKPANQLMMMENALIIYRITRAPERRIFYVDVSNLPPNKAKSYLQNLKNMYRNKMSYDTESGTFEDKKHLQTMQEDYWLPRNSNGRGTEVSTLAGGQNLGEIDDILYFQRRLYNSLNVPTSRLEPETSMLGGRGAEISRDELKFLKFVSKIRKRFNLYLLDLLKTEVILSKVMTVQEWNKIEDRIYFDYSQDLQLEEMRSNELQRERLDILTLAEPFIGKYFSHKYARQEFLKQSERDREDIDKEIAEEKNNPQYKPAEEENGMGRF